MKIESWVTYKGQSYELSLLDRSYACNMRNLTHIPCIHVIYSIWHNNNTIEDHVVEFYTKDSWRRYYKFILQPMIVEKLWSRTSLWEQCKVDPIKVGEKPKNPYKLSSVGRHMIYQICFERGHNKQWCSKTSEASSSVPNKELTIERSSGRLSKNQVDLV